MYHNSCTHTHERSLMQTVCMDVCTCVYVGQKCACMCMCVHVSISYMYTLTQTRMSTIHVNNMHGKRHMCTCTMIHTSTHMSGRSCSLVCMDVCTCVSQCVYVCVSIYLCHALNIDTDANTQCTYTTYMQKDTCAIVTQFIQTHYMSGRSCSLVCMDMRTFVDMCHTVCTYVCVCICIYIIHLHLDTRTCMYNTCINVT